MSHATFFPDGTRLALIVSVYEVPTLEVWELRGNVLLASVRLRRGLNDLAISPAGRRVVTVGMDGHARVWRTADLRPLGVLRGRACSVLDLTWFAPNRLASGACDGTRRVWTVR